MLIEFVLISFFIFLLGSAFASFFYRIAYQYSLSLKLSNKNSLSSSEIFQKLLMGASCCERCGRRLDFFELFPVFNIFFTRGKCRDCGYKIPLKYFLAELLMGLVAVLIFYFRDYLFSNNYELALACVVFLFCSLVSIVDFETKRIPNILNYSAVIIVAIAQVTFSYFSDDFARLPELGLAAIAGFGFILLPNILTKGRAFGWGDAKFLVFSGLLLGSKIIGVLYIAVFAALAYGLVSFILLALQTKDKKQIVPKFRKYTIPLGPFLSLGTVLMYIIGSEIIDFFLALLNILPY